MHIYSYNNNSDGAKALSAAVKSKLISHVDSRFKGNANKDVINWGSSVLPDEVEKCNVYNRNAWISSDKLETFMMIKDKEYCPKFYTDKEEAAKDMKEGTVMVCRTILNGHSGQGIVLADKPEALVDAPLYVKYILKKDEYRVHVAFGKAIHIQRKARNKDVPDDKVNWKIRNHNNGFIFQQENPNPPACVVDCAIDAVDTCELDFGAVDVVYNEKLGKAFVLEINSAPGITGSTIDKYKEAFKDI